VNEVSTARQLAGYGALAAVVLSPWLLAAWQRRQAVGVPLAAEYWFLVGNGCRASARCLGELGLTAEARYWKVVSNAH
jgi:hypothetical protein